MFELVDFSCLIVRSKSVQTSSRNLEQVWPCFIFFGAFSNVKFPSLWGHRPYPDQRFSLAKVGNHVSSELLRGVEGLQTNKMEDRCLKAVFVS